MVMDRHAGDVHRQQAGRCFHVDHDDDRTALDASPEDNLTPAAQARTRRLAEGRNTFGAFGAQNNS